MIRNRLGVNVDSNNNNSTLRETGWIQMIGY